MLPESRPAPAREMRIHGAVVESDLPRLSDYLQEVLSTAPERVVVDLSTCPSLHPDAITELVAAQGQLRTSGGVIDLRGTPATVRAQLQDAGVDGLFTHSPAKKLARVLPLR